MEGLPSLNTAINFFLLRRVVFLIVMESLVITSSLGKKREFRLLPRGGLRLGLGLLDRDPCGMSHGLPAARGLALETSLEEGCKFDFVGLL